MEFEREYQAAQALVEQALRTVFQGGEEKAELYAAMEYSLLAGGKRIRPVLTLACCRLCGGTDGDALSLACAVEMIHTYSLIHDDLPCMDDDELRRGKPTNHKVFGEATALLAGDGLLTAAFETALGAAARLPAGRVVEALEVLSAAAGPAGMVGGQALDLAGEGRVLVQGELEEIHRLKTGAMLTAAAELGCIAAGATQEERQAVRDYASHVGLAFQIRDDMLDVESTEEELGKPIGSDADNGKTTFATLCGLEACADLVAEHTRLAKESVARAFEDAGFLCALADRLAERGH